MSSEWVVWTLKAEPGGCVLAQMTGFDTMWELTSGAPLASRFPSDVTYRMHPDFPYDIGLDDNVINSDRLIVASPRLRRFLEERKVPCVEYLPLTILDHRGRVATCDHVIVNLLEPIDCLDRTASGATFSLINPANISDVDRIVLNTAPIDPKREIFRPSGLNKAILTRKHLADAIDQAGFTGVRWLELSNFPEH